MAQIIGPYISQTVEKPLIIVEDSKKNEDGITLRLNGSLGPSEFSLEDIAEVHRYLGEFLDIKGVNGTVEAQAAEWLRSAKERGIDISVSHG